MQISGIISEYNPFHNGHKYQIEQTKLNGATHIVAVMSSNIVQRGDISIIDKHKRALCAVNSGVDLVIELPVPYSCSSAEIFAKSGVDILNKIGVVDKISFGSEIGDIELLKKCALASLDISENENVSKLISEGISYPSAISQIIAENYDESIANIFNEPNNTLGIEYIKALITSKSSIKPITIKRKSVAHDSFNANDNFASASMIRNNVVSNSKFENFLPEKTNEILKVCTENGEVSNIKNIEKVILFKIATMTKQEFANITDISGGLDDRLISIAKSSNTLEEFLANAKTKCYTLARIRRVIMHTVLGIKKSDLLIPPQYARILAFNEKGREILAQMKVKSQIPFSTSLAELSKVNENAKRLAQLDEISSLIFSMAVENQSYKKNEYTVKVSKV